MTGTVRTPWPGRPQPPDEPPPAPPDGSRPDGTPFDRAQRNGRAPDPGDARLRARLAEAVAAADAPDVVLAVSRGGRRVVCSGGTAPPPGRPRESLRYEIGSATKAFTGLLLARLVQAGRLTGGEPAAPLLGGDPARTDAPVTLAHLITHTAGLPALPPGFLARALPAWHTNPYARFPDDRVVAAFLRHRPRHRPGTRWRYSNFGVAVLGHALATATGSPWPDLTDRLLLRPLGLDDTTVRSAADDRDATGHRADGRRLPPFDPGGFQAAGAVRATPHDLLTFLEAHLEPSRSPDLAAALDAVRTPVLRRGLGHRHVHTAAWFRHPADGGPLYFHGGATLGQQAFLGFRPDTGTALAAVCTRRFRARDPFVAGAYALLAED
ncbi:serine hydrolase domain-containing protein [Streptomyces sp. NPDC029526]|uniref:serine hydrolase domain-containing protein n=1 Tax=Streptomyces sp. NPDC029526 TaxID=3155728 RepID=UPI0033D774B3